MTGVPNFRALPRIDDLVAAAAPLVQRFGVTPTTQALRDAVDDARAAMAQGAPAPAVDALLATAEQALTARHPGPPRRVINATGVIIHTNLGRAPLSAASVAAITAASGYCDVEFNLDDGSRGTRSRRLQPLLSAVTGAAAGIAVNNAAAGLVLALAALAGGREVLVSRGELVEIGGSFRLPEIMTAAGVRLVEVGTTNRTRAEDYLAGDDVALLLKVHPSNYQIAGFTQAPSTAQLADVAARRGIPLLYDVGSGLLAPRAETWLRDEPDVRSALKQGADLVLCSGDKLLGGPQAGVLVGDADLVARCAAHPLSRAMRLDKVRLAALVATLESHARGAVEELPVWAAMLQPAERLLERLRPLAQDIPGAQIVEATAVVGGGSAPHSAIPTPVLRVPVDHPDDAARRLRRADPPVIVRVESGALIIDLRAVLEVDDRHLGGRLGEAFAPQATQ